MTTGNRPVSEVSPDIGNSLACLGAVGMTSRSGMAKKGVAISMNGRGQALDDVFVERLWRTVKHEKVYLRDYADGWRSRRVPLFS